MYKYNISDAMRILWQLCAFLVHNFETKILDLIIAQRRSLLEASCSATYQQLCLGINSRAVPAGQLSLKLARNYQINTGVMMTQHALSMFCSVFQTYSLTSFSSIFSHILLPSLGEPKITVYPMVERQVTHSLQHTGLYPCWQQGIK